jgi:hypothetical protein
VNGYLHFKMTITKINFFLNLRAIRKQQTEQNDEGAVVTSSFGHTPRRINTVGSAEEKSRRDIIIWLYMRKSFIHFQKSSRNLRGGLRGAVPNVLEVGIFYSQDVWICAPTVVHTGIWSDFFKQCIR